MFDIGTQSMFDSDLFMKENEYIMGAQAEVLKRELLPTFSIHLWVVGSYQKKWFYKKGKGSGPSSPFCLLLWYMNPEKLWRNQLSEESVRKYVMPKLFQNPEFDFVNFNLSFDL